jgi:prephenate dehydrogenase
MNNKENDHVNNSKNQKRDGIEIMNVTVVGLGLIGGSIALDLKKSGMASQIVGVDLNQTHANRALELGLVEEISPLSSGEGLGVKPAIALADLIILAIPVGAMTALLPIILDSVSETAVVMDCGSTKFKVCQAVRNHPRRKQFVAAHPLAGTENSGPDAAFAGLFSGKTNIICERDQSSNRSLEIAGKVFEALGMKTIFMEADEHDKHVAYVSHLSHVSSFLLGQTVLDIEKDEKNIFNLASTGFASTVRLAKSSPDMWAPIFEQNGEYLGQALMEYIMHLQKFHYHLMKKDTKELHKILTKANEIRRVLEGIELGSRK